MLLLHPLKAVRVIGLETAQLDLLNEFQIDFHSLITGGFSFKLITFLGILLMILI